jgi:hypothetical protein
MPFPARAPNPDFLPKRLIEYLPFLNFLLDS